MNNRRARVLALCLEDDGDVVLHFLHERVAAAELLGEQVREVGREPLAQPHVVPVALGDGVAPPLVGDFVHDGRTAAA